MCYFCYVLYHDRQQINSIINLMIHLNFHTWGGNIATVDHLNIIIVIPSGVSLFTFRLGCVILLTSNPFGWLVTCFVALLTLLLLPFLLLIYVLARWLRPSQVFLTLGANWIFGTRAYKKRGSLRGNFCTTQFLILTCVIFMNISMHDYSGIPHVQFMVRNSFQFYSIRSNCTVWYAEITIRPMKLHG